MRFSLRSWLHIAGGAFGLLGVVFVFMRLNTYMEQIDLTRFNTTAWSLIGLLALVYGAANVLLAQAWWHLLAFFNVEVERKWALKAYGLSQLAKYVPGNIFHLAGRQALGMAAGLPAGALAKSTLWELGLIAAAGALFGILATPLVWPALPVPASAEAFGLMSAVSIITLRWLLSPAASAAFIWQIFFLVISGAVFMGALFLVAPSVAAFSNFSVLCGAYVIAWLAGLVTPGAPAGVGVREFILLFLLGEQIPETDLLLAVVLGRIITVIGDLLFFTTVSTSKRLEGTMIKREKLVNWQGIALALLASLVVYLSNLSIAGPMIQADEGSYLANAAALAGFPNDLAGSYSAGYSLLLVPAYWFSSTPEGIWAGVKVINASLFFITVICLWFAAKILSPNSSQMRLAGAVTLVSLYPMWVVLAGYSFAQIAFVPFFLIVFIALSRAVEDGWLTWFLLGIAAGFLYWIHPTAIAVLIALAFSCTFIAVKRRAFIEYVVLLTALGSMILFYKYEFTPWLHERMTISGEPPNPHYPSFSKMIAPLLSFNGLAEIAVRLSGHVFYLILGTTGLIGVGLFYLSSRMLNSSHETCKKHILFYRAIGIFLWLSILGVIALSVLLFSTTPEAQRLDHWMYGRYVEGIIPPILLAGALSSTYRTALWTLPVLLACTILFWMGLIEYSGNARFNVSAFWQQFYLQEKGVLAWAATGGAIILLIALIPRRAGIMLMIGLFVFSDYLQVDWHDHASNIAANRWKAALKVRENYPLGKCVGFDHSGIDSYEKHVFWFDAGFILFDYALQRISFDKWISTCDGPLFSYDRYLDERNPDIHIEALAPHGGPYLWVKGKLPSEKHYPMNVENRSISPLQTLGEGWHDLEASHVWSSNLATLKLPVVDHCRKHSCFVTLKLAAYGASKERPVKLLIKNTKNDDWSKEVIFKNSNIVPVHVPLNGHYLINRLSLSVPDAISPKDLQGSNDPRILGVALSEITLDGELSVNGAELLRLPKTVGRVEGSAIISDGREGFLAFGPYQPVAAGKYKLILRGKSEKLDSALVDIVSSQGTVQHGKFALKPTTYEGGVLAEGQIVLDAPVEDIEIRIYVGAEDDVTLEGYELVPVETEDHSASLEHNPLN